MLWKYFVKNITYLSRCIYWCIGLAMQSHNQIDFESKYICLSKKSLFWAALFNKDHFSLILNYSSNPDTWAKNDLLIHDKRCCVSIYRSKFVYAQLENDDDNDDGQVLLEYVITWNWSIDQKVYVKIDDHIKLTFKLKLALKIKAFSFFVDLLFIVLVLKYCVWSNCNKTK